MDLSRGGNAELAKRGQATVNVELGSAPGEMDISCYLVGPNGKVPNDSYMVFYNQPADPQGAMRFSQQGSRSTFTIDVDKLSPNIARCVFAATLSSGVFQQVRDLVLSAKGEGDILRYSLNDMASERAMILGEMYRHNAGWKLRAVGQGFNGGLKALAESFGVAVEGDPAPAAPPPPKPAAPPASPIRLGKVVLDKPNAEAKISLAKKGAVFNIGVRMNWHSGVDLDLHAFYKLKSGATGHVYFANKGAGGGPPYIVLDRDAAVGGTAGNNEENLTITQIDEVEAILFAANIFSLGGLIGLGNDNFAKYDGVVTVFTGDQEIIVPLASKEPGRWAVIALLENLGEPRVVRIDKVIKHTPKLDDFYGRQAPVR